MFEGCDFCCAANQCGLDPMCDECDYKLEKEIEKARADYYQAWLAYVGEYADS